MKYSILSSLSHRSVFSRMVTTGVRLKTSGWCTVWVVRHGKLEQLEQQARKRELGSEH